MMVEILADDVRKLRQLTGRGLMECKGALRETQGNLKRAIALLRERLPSPNVMVDYWPAHPARRDVGDGDGRSGGPCTHLGVDSILEATQGFHPCHPGYDRYPVAHPICTGRSRTVYLQVMSLASNRFSAVLIHLSALARWGQ